LLQKFRTLKQQIERTVMVDFNMCCLIRRFSFTR